MPPSCAPRTLLHLSAPRLFHPFCHRGSSPVASDARAAPSFPANFFQILAPSARPALETFIYLLSLSSLSFHYLALFRLAWPLPPFSLHAGSPRASGPRRFSVRVRYLLKNGTTGERDPGGRTNRRTEDTGERNKEGRTLERHDKRREEPPCRDAGSISVGGSFFRWRSARGGRARAATRDGGGECHRVVSASSLSRPLPTPRPEVFLFATLQLTTLLLLQKRATSGGNREGEYEEGEDWRDKAASSCW